MVTQSHELGLTTRELKNPISVGNRTVTISRHVMLEWKNIVPICEAAEDIVDRNPLDKIRHQLDYPFQTLPNRIFHRNR